MNFFDDEPELTPTQKVIQKYVPAPKGVGNDTFRDVVNGAYNAYCDTGVAPSVDEVVKWSGRSKYIVSKVMGTDAFKIAMRERGVAFVDKFGLSAEQSYLISLLTNPTDKRTLSAKLKAAGVPYNRYRAWLKDPFFKNYLNSLSERMLSDHQGDVLTQLTAKATSGDMRAIQFFLEVTGRHDPRRMAEVNVQSVLMQIVEVITKHVRNPETLRAIATEMQMRGLTGGAAPVGSVVQGTALTEQDQDSTEPVSALPPVTPKTVYFDQKEESNGEFFDF